ncbi:MAG: hypothetical protein ACPLXC_01045 [Candidatus Pacearchaeota archaeon]
MGFFNKNKDKRIELSFQKMKSDVLNLQQEITILKQEIQEINSNFNAFLGQFKQVLHSNRYPAHIQHKKPIPTHNSQNQAINQPYFHSSIGNKGVPTDSQQTVNRQPNTLKRISFYNKNLSYIPLDSSDLRNPNLRKIPGETPIKNTQTPLQVQDHNKDQIDMPQLSNIVSNMKQELQEKFKKLTKQEFFVFSVLYSLEEEKSKVTYRDIALRAKLAESSVRDYVSRLEYKGIPLVKERINNKVVSLKISPELRNIVTLDSLSKLVRF